MLIIFKTFMYKFFSLGRSFISITLVVLKLNKKFVQGIGSIHLPPPPLKLREGLTNRVLQLKFPVKL